MDLEKEQESYSFVFLKQKHLKQNNSNEIQTKLTSQEIIQKLMENLIESKFFDLIDQVNII